MLYILRIVLISLFLPACTDPIAIELESKSEYLTVTAIISPNVTDFRSGGGKISGQIEVKNTTASPQKYGNQLLLLRNGEDLISRTWLDSIASHAIDIGLVDVSPEESLSLSVYWVSPEENRHSLNMDALVLEITPSAGGTAN